MQNRVLKFAFETYVHRVLLVLVGGFNFRQGTYNVPPGSSANSYGEVRRAEFDGTGVRVDGPEKCPLNFFELCGHLELIYILVWEIK